MNVFGRDSQSMPSPLFYGPSRLGALEKRDAFFRVAIILRTRNRPLLLHRSLSSVLSQKYDKWHLYLVNDGGQRDEVDRLLGRYAHLFGPRITVIHHEKSKGMQKASNAALVRGNEELVAVHDDDDAWHPDFLSETTKFFSSPENIGFVAVTTGCIIVSEKIERDRVIEVGRSFWPGRKAIIDFKALTAINQFPPICMVFRRDAIALIGPFNDELTALGDWEFNLRLSLLGDFGFIDRGLAYYHQRVRGTDTEYSNTVIDGIKIHEEEDVRLRNAMMRGALANSPEILGLIVPITRSLYEIEKKLETMERKLETQLEKQQAIERVEYRIMVLIGLLGNLRSRLFQSWATRILQLFRR